MTDWEEYLTALAKPGAWTSLLEIHAAAKHLDRPILIYSPSMPAQVCNRSGKAGPPLVFWYEHSRYELVEGNLSADAVRDAVNAPKLHEVVGLHRVFKCAMPQGPPSGGLGQISPPISQRGWGSGADQPLPSAAQPCNSLKSHLAASGVWDRSALAFCCAAFQRPHQAQTPHLAAFFRQEVGGVGRLGCQCPGPARPAGLPMCSSAMASMPSSRCASRCLATCSRGSPA